MAKPENVILVIEDVTAAQNVAGILAQAGYASESAGDFESARDFIKNRNPVLLICCDFSEKSSATAEICRRLCSAVEINLPPVCVIGEESSNTATIGSTLEGGAYEYIESPFEPLKFIKTVTTLIEAQRAKNSLEQRDVLFRSLIENITDIITVISPDGAVLYESPSVERILGRKPIDTPETNAFEFIHPDDRRRVIDYISSARLEEAEKGVEYRIRHSDGSWRIFHSTGRFNKSIFKTKTILITSRDVTARNLLAERHQAALKKTRMVWWEWDIIKDEAVTSDNFADVYGLDDFKTSEEVFGVVHEHDAKTHRKLVKSLIKSGGSYHAEFRIVRPDSEETVWLEETATAILNDENEVERIVGISFDVSERKKAEKDLRESEEKFRALFKGIPIPVYIWEKDEESDDDLILVDSNDAGDQQTTSFSSRYFGMKASELLDDEPQMLEGLRRCLKEKKVIHLEVQYHHQETKELKILDLYFVCVSPNLVMVVSRDITQIKFAEEERAELVAQIEFQNRRLSDIISSIPGAVWETRVSADLQSQENIYVSDYVEKMTGYSAGEWLSQPDFWLKIMHPDDKQESIARTNDFIRNDGEGFLSYRFVKKNGEVIWTETHMKIVRNHLGQAVSLTGITTDITERKRAEAALLKSEEQLRQSQRLESVGRLAGGIAHDFNNMLTAINGYSDLILRELHEDGSIRQKVSEIKKAGERSALLTQQLLAFSRRQILKPQRLDFNHVVSDMTNLLRRLIGEHIGLVIDLDPEECRVEADPGQLSQVIMNLVVNARDVMPNGGDLVITTKNVRLDEKYAAQHIPTAPGDYVLLSVSDTGTGVDDETKKHLFEPFYTTKEKGLGTGLGLATVYGIVKQSGGYIWVDSEPGRGTTFEIYLPQIKDESKMSSEKNKVGAELTGTETILLVEDEESVRELTVKILNMYGYTVIEANDGVEAFEIYKNAPDEISLLITDIVMPRMSGRELAEKISDIEPDVRVLFSSGYSDDRNVMRSVDVKKFDFINKPFTPEKLARKVRRLFDEPIGEPEKDRA